MHSVEELQNCLNELTDLRDNIESTVSNVRHIEALTELHPNKILTTYTEKLLDECHRLWSIIQFTHCVIAGMKKEFYTEVPFPEAVETYSYTELRRFHAEHVTMADTLVDSYGLEINEDLFHASSD